MSPASGTTRIRCSRSSGSASAYRECPELGWGTLQVLEHDARRRSSTAATGRAGRCCCATTWADACSVTIALPEERARNPLRRPRWTRPTELTFGDGGALALDLEPYAARWYRLVRGETAALL